MGRTSRNTLDSAMLGALAGMAGRMAYDNYNEPKMINDYKKEAIVPERKSMFMAMGLTFLFGSLGLMYSSPKVGIFTLFIEVFLFFCMFMPLLIFLVIPLFFLRLFLLLLAFVSTYSHNNMIKVLFNKIDEEPYRSHHKNRVRQLQNNKN